MLDAGHELEMLKNKLMSRGFSYSEANGICEQASNSMRDAIVDIIADTLQDVVTESEDGTSHKFVQEAMAIRDGSLFKISTSSGRTDFSEPSFPMLPRLLSNAKVSKDGSRYRRVPIRKKISDSSLPKTVENAVKQINQQREQLKSEKTARLEKRRGGISDPVDSITQIKTYVSDQPEKRFNNSQSSATEFRTASDKQDPNATWIYPAKKADMTEVLEKANIQLQDRIDRAISNILSEYGGYY
jgi:hypothetical protein